VAALHRLPQPLPAAPAEPGTSGRRWRKIGVRTDAGRTPPTAGPRRDLVIIRADEQLPAALGASGQSQAA